MTSDELIEAVRDFANLSPSAEDSEDAQLLRRLNVEQSLYLTTLLERAKGQHRQSTLDISTSADTLRYPIPTRAVAAGIKMLEGVDSSGRSWMLYDYSDENAARFGSSAASNGQFYVEGGELVFYSSPPAGTLRVTYSRRMSTLVMEDEAAVIVSITPGASTTAIVIDAAPTDFAAGITSYDFVRSTPHFDILYMGALATRSSTTMTFANAGVPDDLAVGDYVALAGETPVCQAPLELHPLLALRAAYVWSRAKNDPIANVLEKDLKEAAGLAVSLLEPRIEQDGVLVNPWAPGWGRWAFRRSQ